MAWNLTSYWRPLALLAVRGLANVGASRQNRAIWWQTAVRYAVVTCPKQVALVVSISNGEHPALVRSLDHWSRRVPALSMSRGSASGNVVWPGRLRALPQ